MTKQIFSTLAALAFSFGSTVASAQDTAAVPDTQPPAGSVAEPPAVPPPVAVSQVAPAPTGQWVYTSEYGWIWEPYGQPYTYVSDNVAYTYAYYPTYGWRWVYSPWVIGVGPEPYWGNRGWSRFTWYGAYGYRGGYHGTYGYHGAHGYRGGVVGHQARPGYYRAAPGRGAAHWGGGRGYHGGGHGRR